MHAPPPNGSYALHFGDYLVYSTGSDRSLTNAALPAQINDNGVHKELPNDKGGES